jgi:hypothetical protein
MLNLPVHGPAGLTRSSAPSSGTCTPRSARSALHAYLIAVPQADTFLRGRGTCLDAASQADLEPFMADLLARRTANTAATYRS